MNGIGSWWQLWGRGAERAGGFSVAVDPGRDWEAIRLANRELIRPVQYTRATPGLVPFSTAWFDELEQKRYQRHGRWLPPALEFDRHPGERILIIGAGLGNDALQYARHGAVPVILVAPDDPLRSLRQNLARYPWEIELVEVDEPPWPVPAATADVVLWNALYEPWAITPERIQEVHRLLKPGGKLIVLAPAWYDTAYWQDRFVPLQSMYWQRPADPTTAPKYTGRQLRRLFCHLESVGISKRHLRRSELPHPWRLIPLALLERLMGRVLVLKGIKPICPAGPLAATSFPPTPLSAAA